ncbi:MAG: choice-of-anchor D domain-containing protein [Verrucomicrobia bacterium]|nr:choice-of-anchor D domain-containing protein [Verrucomicrobiota bacterium]
MTINILPKAVVALAACLAFQLTPVLAAPGDLDANFGIGGRVTTSIGGSRDRVGGMALQSDGKLVVAGGSFNGSDYDFALVRYRTNGTLDTSFGNLGMVTTPIGNAQDFGRSVAVQSDGKIVVAGDSYNGTNSDFALVRYLADGILDATFGSGGKVTTSISGNSGEMGRSVAVQTDVKIVVAGYSDNGTVKYDFALVRYQADGTLDSTFGIGGKVTTPIGSGDDQGYSVAVQRDGKIVVAGDSYNGSNRDFALVRYLSDGSLDTTFGTGGKVTTPIGLYDDNGQSVAVQSDGRIVVAGSSSNGSIDDYDFALVCYLSDGSLDTTFGAGGKVTTDIGSGSDDTGHSVALQSDGKVVVAGSSYNGANYDFALARYLANGTLDTTFGNGGKLVTAVGGSDDIGWGVAVQGDGKIVVAGDFRNGSDYDFALVRYLGTTEPEIAVEQPAGNNLTDGRASIDFGNLAVNGGPTTRWFTVRNASTAILTGLAVSKDGLNAVDFTLGALGATTLGPGESTTFDVSFVPDALGLRTAAIYVARNDADENPFYIALTGSGVAAPDITTDLSLPSGMVGAPYRFTLAASGGAEPYTWTAYSDLPPGLSLSSAGVVSGTPTAATNASFNVRVFGNDGLASSKVTFTLTIIPTLDPGDLDTSFGTGGKVTTAIGSADDNGYSVAAQSDGKILVAGYSMIGNYAKFALARYLADGTLDTSFGTSGKVTTSISPYSDYGRTVAVQSDGKILVAGEFPSSGYTSIALVRYETNGTLDTTFGSGGKATNSFGFAFYGRTVMLQSDGKILVGGEASAHCADFGMVRFLADGSLDGTFGSGGLVTTDIGTNSCDYPQGAALQPDGKILVAGYAPGLNGTNGNDFALVRYLVNGTLDTAFGNGGKVTTAIASGSGGDLGRSVAVQTDGKIVVAGEFGSGDFVLVRYLADGTLDNSFGSGGKVTIAINNYGGYARSVAVQSDGKIVVAGYCFNGSDNDFAVARYNANGTLDASFGTGGKMLTAVGPGQDYGRSMIIQSDGRIAVAGSSYNGTNNDFALVRYIGSLAPEIVVEQPAGTNLADGGASIGFGTIVPGKPSFRAFTVRNAGTASLTGLALGKDGVNPGDFRVDELATTNLAPGASFTFTVTFVPSAVGPRSAAIHIASNDADENPFDITLTGAGYGNSPLQAWRLTHFGSVFNSGDGANLNDFDQDGIQNLLEYAFGGDPTIPDAAAIRPRPVLAGGTFSYSFKCNANCTDITYTVQASSSLEAGSWTDIARSIGGSTVLPVGSHCEVSDAGTGLRWATVTPSAALFPTGRGFLRIKVSE